MGNRDRCKLHLGGRTTTPDRPTGNMPLHRKSRDWRCDLSERKPIHWLGQPQQCHVIFGKGQRLCRTQCHIRLPRHTRRRKIDDQMRPTLLVHAMTRGKHPFRGNKCAATMVELAGSVWPETVIAEMHRKRRVFPGTQIRLTAPLIRALNLPTAGNEII